KKVMVMVWWSAVGIFHYSFLNPGETIRAENSSQQVDETTTSYISQRKRTI
ncbi:hypothetical protein Angca_006137, partial [Angiostrongylus cantonensis]